MEVVCNIQIQRTGDETGLHMSALSHLSDLTHAGDVLEEETSMLSHFQTQQENPSTIDKWTV